MDHFLDQFSSLAQVPVYLAPATVLLISLMGSLHCLGMCGPFSLMAATDSRSSLWLYHLGRLIGYLLLGLTAGWLGDQLLTESRPALALLATIAMALSFAWVGWNLWHGSSLHIRLPRFFERFVQGLWTRAKSKNHRWTGLTIGLLTPLLPCGWLYAFIFAAVVTESPLWGSLLMTFFWLGTVPALATLQYMGRKPGQWFGLRYQKWAAAIFFVISLTLLAGKLGPSFSRCQLDFQCWVQPATAPACH